MMRFMEGGGHAADGMAEKANRRHAGEQAALPQKQPGVQMADDRLFDLRQPAVNGLLAVKKDNAVGS